ncbi:hypothetical protein PILCRDRAFT_16259 [Piloderma croceum F 1598]|uniref:Uncharacterized protein n=1 Tax=Piloderma croceum (strain F 1598) TaxID=765440 RepID=A0A0C3EWC4_PILCF|nr:hypothetical protein PILCRDRAFT_16259 [Piloderma croceum F 1598]
MAGCFKEKILVTYRWCLEGELNTEARNSNTPQPCNSGRTWSNKNLYGKWFLTLRYLVSTSYFVTRTPILALVLVITLSRY